MNREEGKEKLEKRLDFDGDWRERCLTKKCIF